MTGPQPTAAPSLNAIREAAEAIRGDILRTPLVLLPDTGSGAPEIWLKLENLQPVGSFKIRGAANLARSLTPDDLRTGVWTASAGNMAQAAAWVARRRGIPCVVVVPDSAPSAKTEAVERMGGRVIRVPHEAWWQAMEDGRFPGLAGRYLPPFDDPLVMAGNGTIGLELIEDLPGVDAILVPYGGGGLAVGIAAAVKALRPSVRVYAVEAETSAPLAASLAAGEPRRVERVPSFVDGIGGSAVFPRMFELARRVLDGSLVASITEIEEAVRVLAGRARVVAEGAGACPVAVALSGRVPAPCRRIACVVSGGNINAAVLAGILAGGKATLEPPRQTGGPHP